MNEMMSIIERVQRQFNSRVDNSSNLESIYVVLPVNWQDNYRLKCIEAIQTLRFRYDINVVIPDPTSFNELLTIDQTINIFTRDEMPCNPCKGTLFLPVFKRNQMIKVALCLSDEFETKWLLQGIEEGQKIYVSKQSLTFTGKESFFYRSKVEKYAQEVKSYGVIFDDFPKERKINQQVERKKIITTEDLEYLVKDKKLEMSSQDILTELAREKLLEQDVEIVEQIKK